jgi:hypothetical protein
MPTNQLIDRHTKPIPTIGVDFTGHKTILCGVMRGLQNNISSPSNRKAYNHIAEAIAALETAELYRKDDCES